MFSLNWLTWETKSYGIPKKLGTEGKLGGRILESALELRLDGAHVHPLPLPATMPALSHHESGFSWKESSLFVYQKIGSTLEKGLLFRYQNPGIPATCLFREVCPNFSPRLPRAMLYRLTFHCYDKHQKQTQLRKKGVIGFICKVHITVCYWGKSGLKLKQESGCRDLCRDHKGMRLWLTQAALL